VTFRAAGPAASRPRHCSSRLRVSQNRQRTRGAEAAGAGAGGGRPGGPGAPKGTQGVSRGRGASEELKASFSQGVMHLLRLNTL
jgi:hypothetical protein